MIFAVSIVVCAALSLGVVPHCVSLRYFAAYCALCLYWMWIPFLSLLWNGVGVYFFLSSLIPNHLSLRSKSFEMDSRILFLLSSFLLFVPDLWLAILPSQCFNNDFPHLLSLHS